MMHIQLVIFDVDGTLYDLNKHCIPASTIHAIQQMKKKKLSNMLLKNWT